MKSLPTLKDVDRERRLFRVRIIVACVAMVLAVGVIVGRLVWLQVINHDHFTTLSHENRLKVVPLAPPRGLIFSRDGVVLA
ncbi:MAG: penicillin-binding protein 2, partial [Gammaproteobacteria bacterium]